MKYQDFELAYLRHKEEWLDIIAAISEEQSASTVEVTSTVEKVVDSAVQVASESIALDEYSSARCFLRCYTHCYSLIALLDMLGMNVYNYTKVSHCTY